MGGSVRPMKKHRWKLVALTLILVGGLIGFLSPLPSIVIGLFRHEAFYHYRPTNYWKGQVQQHLDNQMVVGNKAPSQEWWRKLLDKFRSSVPAQAPEIINFPDPPAASVLIDLLEDQDSQI